MQIPRSIRAVAIVAAVVGTHVVAAAGVAGAQADGGAARDDREQVVLTGNLLVPSGDTVTTAVSFNGDARVDGTVTESLVVFNGGATITGTVEQDVFVFNGPVVVQSGATVGGDIVSRQTPQIADGADVRGRVTGVTGRVEWHEVGLIGRFAWWLGYSVSTLILGLVLLLIAPALDAAIRSAAGRRMGASIGLGAALFFLTPIVAVLLLITIVGIPLGVLVLLALGLLYTVGYVAGAHAIGRFVVKPPTSRYLAFLAGWGIVRVIGLIPFLGGLAWILVGLFGLGVLFVAARTGPRREEVMAPPPPPPYPAPA